MVKILEMRFIRYANLFNRITKIRANHCFEYNNAIVFAVPRKFVMKAIGPNNKNLEKLSKLIRKKIRIVAIPEGIEGIENFVSVIIKPAKFRSIEVKDSEVIISADTQNKAAIIGRDKVRLKELENILEQYFGIKKVRTK
jgi:transcription antitermination factor NusA-like protein